MCIFEDVGESLDILLGRIDQKSIALHIDLVVLDGGICALFFFQAEDGIRDADVTGVQTCALPIFPPKIITDAERQVVEEGMHAYATVKDYKVDVKGSAILIYTAEQDIEALANIFKDTHPDRKSVV